MPRPIQPSTVLTVGLFLGGLGVAAVYGIGTFVSEPASWTAGGHGVAIGASLVVGFVVSLGLASWAHAESVRQFEWGHQKAELDRILAEHERQREGPPDPPTD